MADREAGRSAGLQPDGREIRAHQLDLHILGARPTLASPKHDARSLWRELGVRGVIS